MLRRRVGEDRAPYEVNDEVVTVLVAKIGHGATCIDSRADGASRALFVADSALRLSRVAGRRGGSDPQRAWPSAEGAGARIRELRGVAPPLPGTPLVTPDAAEFAASLRKSHAPKSPRRNDFAGETPTIPRSTSGPTEGPTTGPTGGPSCSEPVGPSAAHHNRLEAHELFRHHGDGNRRPLALLWPHRDGDNAIGGRHAGALGDSRGSGKAALLLMATMRARPSRRSLWRVFAPGS